MNIVIHTGRLGADPEVRKTNSGKSVVNASVAVYAGKDLQGNILTDWYRWTVWGDQADRFAAKARKGDAVMMKGRSTVKAYQKDGQDVKVTEFVCEDFMVQKKEEPKAAVVTSVKASDYNFEDFPQEPLPWE
ncbi:MAG: single-stranded DNA-binding protein [Oscillospiraceae bacterium]|nr:single-stranded DNA-binding protein [Oscillospiraceae bacterium]